TGANSSTTFSASPVPGFAKFKRYTFVWPYMTSLGPSTAMLIFGSLTSTIACETAGAHVHCTARSKDRLSRGTRRTVICSLLRDSIRGSRQVSGSPRRSEAAIVSPLVALVPSTSDHSGVLIETATFCAGISLEFEIVTQYVASLPTLM